MKIPRFKVTLRGKDKMLLPRDIQFMKAQRASHNIFSKDGHEWNKSGTKDLALKTCKKCFKVMCYDKWNKNWFPTIATITFTTEDIQELIRINN